MIGANPLDVVPLGAKNLRRGIYSGTHVPEPYPN